MGQQFGYGVPQRYLKAPPYPEIIDPRLHGNFRRFKLLRPKYREKEVISQDFLPTGF